MSAKITQPPNRKIVRLSWLWRWIRSRLRARSGSSLPCHRQDIQHRPVRITTERKKSTHKKDAFLYSEREGFVLACGLGQGRICPATGRTFNTDPFESQQRKIKKYP